MKEKIKNCFSHNWFKIVAIAFLLGALLDNPYSYYQFLRWIILAVGAYSAYLAYESDKKVWMWILGLIALLFNPIIPFHFERETWQIIDVIVAAIFLISMFQRRKNINIKQNEQATN